MAAAEQFPAAVTPRTRDAENPENHAVTDRLSPDDDLLLSYVDGTLAAQPRSELEARLSSDPALRAEVEGLRAVRALLDNDAQWGRDSAVDAPPPHLLQAILTAEVAARPDEIRQAVVLAHAAPTPPKSLWAKMSTWMLGGGVVVGAAAAILIVVSQGDRALQPPAAKGADLKAELDTADSASNAALDIVAPTKQQQQQPPPPPSEPAPADEGAGDRRGLSQGLSEGLSAGLSDRLSDTRAAGDRSVADAKPRSAKAPAPELAKTKDARGFDEDDVGAASGKGDRGGLAALGAGAGGSPPTAPATTAPSMAPPTSVGSSGALSAVQRAEEFRTRRRDVETKKVQKERLEYAEKAEAPSSGASRAAAPPPMTPTEAKEALERQKRLDVASETLTAAERELAAGRAQDALSLAVRAEAAAGTSLGLVPASTQTRAYLALKRFQDAARTGSRLLQGDVADVVIVDGLIAAADAAEAIGDRRLAVRLLQKALLPANKDKARRALAAQKLSALKSKSSRDQDDAPAASAPAKKSSAADPSADGN